MVLQRRLVNHPENEDTELIYVNKGEKRDDEDEIELLNPTLVESIFETYLVDKPGNKCDDSTQSTVDSMGEWMLPTLSTPSQDQFSTLGNDDSSVDSLFSLGLSNDHHGIMRETVPSPRSPVSECSGQQYLSLPGDIKYEGEVVFLNSPVTRQLNLHPRYSKHSESIFVEKISQGNRSKCFPVHHEACLADSLSTIDAYGGVEESKEDDEEEEISIMESEDANTQFAQNEEEDYWSDYVGRSRQSAHDLNWEEMLQQNLINDDNSIQGDSINANSDYLRNDNRSTNSSFQISITKILSGKCIWCFSCENNLSWKECTSKIPLKADSVDRRVVSATTA